MAAVTSSAGAASNGPRTGDGTMSRARLAGDRPAPARGPFPDDRTQGSPDVAGVAPVAEPAVDVSHDAAGQRHIEELRPVGRGDRLPQGQVKAEPAGHEDPAPRGARRGHEGDARNGDEGPAVDPAERVDHGTRADSPEQGDDDDDSP